MTAGLHDEESAARNNAAWCDAVCGTHGSTGVREPDLWWSPRRTPPFYPDAVTLRPGVEPDRVLAVVDHSAGCSVKDSFADLDLADHGFDVIVAARWIRREPPADRSEGAYDVVRDPTAFAEWVAAWNDGEVPSPPVLLPSLVDVVGVSVLAVRRAGRIVGGAVLNLAGDVVGVSNVFSHDDPDEVWSAVLDGAAQLYPGTALVGYESGTELETALRHGFEPLGQLRVWMKPATT